MAGTFAVIGLRSVFEDQDLVCFALFYNRSGYLRAFDYRFANGDFAVVYDSQNFVKYDFCVFSAFSFSTFRTSPSWTRYCLPPVLMIAYI